MGEISEQGGQQVRGHCVWKSRGSESGPLAPGLGMEIPGYPGVGNLPYL